MKNKKAIILSVIASLALLVLIIGATYAYFQASGGDGTSTNLRVTTYTTDVFNFEIGDDILIYADQTSFGSGKGNALGTTFAKAILTANNKTNTTTEHYNLYLNISDNNFKYSISTSLPDLLLTIKDGNNNEITSISGLEHKTVTDAKGVQISGFDITTKTGLLTLLDNREITASPTKTDTWNITVTLINYDNDQSVNMGKIFSGQILIGKDNYDSYTPNTINTLSATRSGSNLTVKLNVEQGSNEIDKYYFAIKEKDTLAINNIKSKIQRLSNALATSNLTYVESTSNSYTFNNIKDDINYEISAYAIDKKKVKTNVYNYNYRTDNYNLPVISKVETSKTTNTITTTVTASKGTNNISKYYYSIDNGNTYKESTSNTYTFTNLKSANYRIIVKVIDTNGIYSNIYVINEKIESSQSQTLAEYVISQYNGVQGNNNIYHHDGTLENGIDDGSYRYAGADNSVNNYVCFGSDSVTCPTDNLYRIIGLFDSQVKIIKATAAKSDLLGTDGEYFQDTVYYNWSSLNSCPSNVALLSSNVVFLAVPGQTTFGCNLWKYSGMNTINLNTNYLNNIGTTWSNMIEDTTWKVSGHSTSSVTPSEMYKEEIANAIKTYGPRDGTSKIGLMYVSDYGFAASPNAWTTKMSSYDNSSIKSVNWMYIGFYEWTITPVSSGSKNLFVFQQGKLFTSTSKTENGFYSRPVMYLKSSVSYIGGSGSQLDPIRIK